MKKILSFVLLLTVLTSCSTTNVPIETQASSEEKELAQYNVLFTLNTQEFVFSQQSIATVNRVIDIHEQYSVPVDIYLDDVILQTYLRESPELIERLKTSPVVSVSYHARPPVPFYNDYDWLGLDDYSTDELESLIKEYGSHAIDPATGETLDAPGGFTYFEEVFGYAPPAAATPTSAVTGKLIQDFFYSNGATFLVDNSKDYSWGETKSGMAVRPEDVEVKLFERTDESAEQIFSELNTLTGTGPYFINIKMHDNDFIADESAWVAIYVSNKKQNRKQLTPPFDLSLAEDRLLLSEEEAAAMWTAYENCVAYAAEHSELYQTWNMAELAELIP